MSPLEFMQRLAAPVPRPRLHLIRFRGVLAPNAKMRAQVVPSVPAEGAEASEPSACEPNCAHNRPVRMSWARLLKRVLEFDLEHCPNCGGELRIIAAILKTPVNRAHPHPPRTAGPSAAAGASAWADAASGLDFHSSFAFRRPGAHGAGCV